MRRVEGVVHEYPVSSWTQPAASHIPSRRVKQSIKNQSNSVARSVDGRGAVVRALWSVDCFSSPSPMNTLLASHAVSGTNAIRIHDSSSISYISVHAIATLEQLVNINSLLAGSHSEDVIIHC